MGGACLKHREPQEHRIFCMQKKQVAAIATEDSLAFVSPSRSVSLPMRSVELARMYNKIDIILASRRMRWLE
jgi:hypothetical protein